MHLSLRQLEHVSKVPPLPLGIRHTYPPWSPRSALIPPGKRGGGRGRGDRRSVREGSTMSISKPHERCCNGGL